MISFNLFRNGTLLPLPLRVLCISYTFYGVPQCLIDYYHSRLGLLRFMSNCCDMFKQNRSNRMCCKTYLSVSNRRTPRIWGVDSRWNTTGLHKMVQESPNGWNGKLVQVKSRRFRAYEHLVIISSLEVIAKRAIAWVPGIRIMILMTTMREITISYVLAC